MDLVQWYTALVVVLFFASGWFEIKRNEGALKEVMLVLSLLVVPFARVFGLL